MRPKTRLASGLLPLGVASLLCSCSAGGMIPGSIYSNDGRVIPFEIEKAHRTGAITARDPVTGEQFTGSYVGVKERVDIATSGTVIQGRAVATGFGSGSAGSNIANATAFLKGDKGSMLNCEMKIEAGYAPHGIGSCQDDQGRPYRLQF